MTYRSMESVIRDVMTEKKLTPAEKKKREEVAQAIERDNPDMPMDQKMAIATATAKRVAEEVDDIYGFQAEDMKSAAKELRTYADKHGGVDKDDFHKAAKHMEAGNHDAIHKHVNRMDTSPRDKVLETLHKHGNDIKRYGYTMEEVQLDEATPTAKQVKQGIGIARDKRYAGGNMTGAVKTMDKINKGLAGHPAVKKELQKQNEAVDPADTGGAEEVSMAMNQVKQIRHYIDGIEKMVAADGDMEEWVQNKLTKATDYLKSVYGYKTGKNEQFEMDMQEAVETNELMKAMMNLVDLEEKARLGGSMKAATGIMKKQITQGGKESDMGRNESTDAYGKSVEKQADDKKKAAMTDSDKQKLGALANLMAKERAKKNEEVELDELDKKTLGSYIRKAAHDAASKAYSSASAAKDNNPEKSGKDFVKSRQRIDGVKLAVKKIAKEDVDLEEAVSVNKKNYSWGKMVTVKHGNSHSYPLHPEHQAKIKALKHDEKTSFKDETGNHVTAHRDGDTINLSGKGTNIKTAVARNHFTEEVEMDEALGTSAKYANRTGIMGGKYKSHDHAITTKNFSKYRDDRAKKRDAEHKAQDPKMQKMGYAKHIVDTQKAKKKAAERGVEYKTQRSNYHNTNSITPNRKLPEEIENILNTVITETQGENNE